VKKITVAFLASTLGVGGSEMVTRELIVRLPADRFASRLFLLRTPGTIGDDLLRSGVPGESGLQKCRFDFTVLWRLSGRLKRHRPDILFSLDHHNALLWGRLSSLFARVPRRVVACHSTGLFGRRGSFTAFDRALMGATDAVVALSDTHARYLAGHEGIAEHKIRVIGNGIDVERFANVDPAAADAVRKRLGIPPGHRIVLMAAALRPEKAHEALLETARRMIQAGNGSGATIHFLIAGEGPREKELRAAADRLGVSGRVHFLGRRNDIPVLLHAANALVLPSHAVVETLPLVVLEAMAAGVPVVASSVGSVPEVVRHGETGRLIPPADPVRLAEELSWVFEHEDEAAKMSERARRLVADRYTVQRMVDGYAKLFESLAAGNMMNYSK
jgi:glycosyltransferase involved in cell wall biosynthesis